MADRHLPTHSLFPERRPYTALGVGLNRADECRGDNGQQSDDCESRKAEIPCDNLPTMVGIQWDRERGFTLFNVISFGAFLIVFSFLVRLAV